MPIFWWGLLLIILFSGILRWTPVSGRISLMYFFPPVTGFMLIDSLISGQKGAFTSAVSHLILPTIVLGTIPLAVIARQTRSAMLEVLGEDYVRTARAKGLSTCRVIGLHALRNAMIPVVTTIGLQVGTLLAGAILTETIFSWPGIGKWMVDSIFRRDYPSVQGGLLLIAAHRHDGQSDRRSALRPHQPAHPPCTMTDATVPAAVIDTRKRRRAGRCSSSSGTISARTGAPSSASRSSSRSAWSRSSPMSSRRTAPTEQYRDALLKPPVWQEGGDPRFILGTDAVGRDMLSRLIYGAAIRSSSAASWCRCRCSWA